MNELMFRIEVEDPDYARLEYLGKKPRSWKEAFQRSIDKWEATLAGYRLHRKITKIADGGWFTCNLCEMSSRMAARGEKLACDHCPIVKVTETSCINSPYDDYILATSRRSRMAAARAEIKFLRKIYKETFGEEYN